MDQPNKQLARLAISLLDLTSLNADDDDAAIVSLCLRALTPFGPVAAVCVYPRFVSLARKTLNSLGGEQVRVATVGNFPYGGSNIASTVTQVEEAIAAGADEVDVVYPFHGLLAGDRDIGRELLGACRNVCSGPVLLKVILETGELRDPQLIRRASLDAIAAGADFIKTSTGKVAINATEQAARIMLQAIAEQRVETGLKVSGGIRTLADAGLYIGLARQRMGAGWVSARHMRIGASGLLDELLACLEQRPA